MATFFRMLSSSNDEKEPSPGEPRHDSDTERTPMFRPGSSADEAPATEAHDRPHMSSLEPPKHEDISHDESSDEDPDEVVKEGVLSKWTNYVHGWQDRYIVLKGSVLSYYKDKEETKTLCRGTIDISKVSVSQHEFDHSRFDVALGSQVFYFRATSQEIRQEWANAISGVKGKSANRLQRRPSTLSLTSINSIASANSLKARTFPEKLAEVKTFRELLANQISSLHTQLAAGATSPAAVDALALKSNTTAMLDTLSVCIDMLSKREEDWERRYEKEVRKRRKAEDRLRLAKETVSTHMQFGSPDYVEGPNLVMKEEEFFDAIETGLDQIDFEVEREQRLARLDNEARDAPVVGTVVEHPFNTFLSKTVTENLALALQDPQKDSDWQMVLEDGELKVYRREIIDDKGVTCDRLKAYHTVPGITAHEMCQYFFDTKYRMEWELEKFFVLERFDPATLVFHNLHKRIWPSAQRDSCCLSHIRDLGNNRWMVQNISVDHEAAPKDKCVRVEANIMLLISTVITPPASGPIKREHVSAHITYLAYINPGGWVPPAALRALSKREYPKFLRTFSSQSLRHYTDKPVML